MLFRLFFCLLFLLGCFPKKAQGPEEVLREYVEYRFTQGQTREKLLELSTGPLKEKIESLTEDQFKKHINTGMFKYKNLKILLKSCTEKSCTITYTLTYYRNQGDGYQTEIKKVAEVDSVENVWKVRDISTVKTYIESDIPIDVP